LGIAIHKIPVAFVLAGFMLGGGRNRITAAAILLLFAIMAPLGAAVHYLWEGLHGHMNYVLAIVVGIFLHVSTTILFESSDNHRFNLYKVIIIIFGASLAFLNL
jgi:zinc transporter ZupT